MDMDNKEYQKMLEANIAVMGVYGISYVDLVHSYLLIMQKYLNGEMKVSEETLRALCETAVKSNEKHLAMLRMSREKRANYDDPDNPNKK